MHTSCSHSSGAARPACHEMSQHQRFTPFSANRLHRHHARGTPIRSQQQHQQQQASGGAGAGSGVLSIFCPLLKLVSGGDAAAPRARWAEVATSGFSSISRLPFGTTVGPGAAARSREPAQTLQLFEFEACPFCRRVREAITDLDLEVDVFPTPKDSVRHRAAALEQGGKLQFPLLIDPNTGDTVYESDAIVRHLYQEYGGGVDNIPKGLIRSTLVRGWVPTLLRAGRGMSRYERAREDAPAQPLQLYDYDANQFSRLVREALCELELPYRRIACGKGSKRRAGLQKAAGSTQVPYLVDPNTGEAIQDSEQAVRYLFATYASAVIG